MGALLVLVTRAPLGLRPAPTVRGVAPRVGGRRCRGERDRRDDHGAHSAGVDCRRLSRRHPFRAGCCCGSPSAPYGPRKPPSAPRWPPPVPVLSAQPAEGCCRPPLWALPHPGRARDRRAGGGHRAGHRYRGLAIRLAGRAFRQPCRADAGAPRHQRGRCDRRV